METDLRELAENPGLHTPVPSGERLADGRFCALLNLGRVDVQRLRLDEDEVEAVVEELRALARARGNQAVNWWVGATATPLDLGDRLVALGLEPDADAPVLRGMVLERQPKGEPSVEVRALENYDEFVQASELDWYAWAPQDLGERRALLPERWEALRGGASQIYVAHLEGEVVGYARAVLGPGAVFLLGAGTAPEARGRGVYTSFVHARWHDAVARGTPRLVIQAGAMSAPIVAKLGFAQVSTIHLYVDDLRD